MNEIKLTGKNLVTYEKILDILSQSPKGVPTPHYINRFNSILRRKKNLPKVINLELRSETDHYKRHLLIAWINKNSTNGNYYRKSRYKSTA